jgi:hypothetical protein
MRIGFLFNHDQIHQVAHSLPIALALDRANVGAEVIVATTNAQLAAEVRRLTPGGARLKHVELRVRSFGSKVLCRTLRRIVPAAKLLIYRDNLDFFRSLDALVVTERTSLILKTRYRLDALKMILSDHGAGDRAIGFGKATALFDHILAAGPKIHDRLIHEAKVDPGRLTITGYPKFDTARSEPKKLAFQSNGRPTVLYNPHVSPHLSSWYKQGRAVLDYFLLNPHYNLIFAPHIMMFQRRAVVTIDKLSLDFPGKLDPRYAAAPNIHVDLGSVASTDMTYTDAADIYLGDVSSQIYEFLKTPRPCLFLDSHRTDHLGDPNFAHWQAGPVIESTEDLGTALEQAVSQHAKIYRQIQRSLFDYTFDLTSEPSSVRAARAIMDLFRITPLASAAKEIPVFA